MVRKFVVTLCILILAVSVATGCKKNKDNPDATNVPDDFIADVFGDGGSDTDFLPDPTDASCGDGTCAVGETPEDCAADCAGAGAGGKANPNLAAMKVSTVLTKVDGKYPLKELKNFEVTARVTGYDDHQLTFEDPVVDNEVLIDWIVINDYDGEKNKVKYEITALALDGEEQETKVTFKAVDPEDAEKVFTIEITILVKKNELKNESIASMTEIKKNEVGYDLRFEGKSGSENYEYLTVEVFEVNGEDETACASNVCTIKRVTDEESVRDEVVFTEIGDYKVYSTIEDVDLGYTVRDEGHAVKVKEKGTINVFLLDVDYQSCLDTVDCKILQEEKSTDTFEINVPYGKLIGIEIAGDAEYDCLPLPDVENLIVDVHTIGEKTLCLVQVGAEDLATDEAKLSFSGQIIRATSPYSDERNLDFSILTFESDPCHTQVELIKVVDPVNAETASTITPTAEDPDSNLLKVDHNILLGSSTDVAFKIQGGSGPFDVMVVEDYSVNNAAIIEYEVACAEGYMMGKEDGCPVPATHEDTFLFSAQYPVKPPIEIPSQDFVINVHDQKCNTDQAFPMSFNFSSPRIEDEKIGGPDGNDQLMIGYRIWTEWTNSGSYAQLTLIAGQNGVAMRANIDVDGDDPTSTEYIGNFKFTPSADKKMKITKINRLDFDYWDHDAPDMDIELTYAVVATKNIYARVSHGEEECEGQHETKHLYFEWKLRCRPGDPTYLTCGE